MKKKLNVANIVLLAFLAVSSGITKIMLRPMDLEFFQAAGWTENLIILFGLTQLIGGVLLLIEKVRKWGAGIVAVTFAISMALLFMAGTFVPFGIFSIVAIALLLLVIKNAPTSADQS